MEVAVLDRGETNFPALFCASTHKHKGAYHVDRWPPCLCTHAFIADLNRRRHPRRERLVHPA